MRVHVIENGVVVNTILVESLNVFAGAEGAPLLIDADLGGQIGDLWANGEFTSPAEDVEAVRETALVSLLAEYDRRRQEPFPYDFGVIVAVADNGNTGPAGVKHLQMRDTDEHPDQGNWNKLAAILALACQGAMLQGGDAVATCLGTASPMRVEENVNVLTNRGEAMAALGAMGAHGGHLLFRHIQLRGAVKGAASAAAIQAVLDGADWEP